HSQIFTARVYRADDFFAQRASAVAVAVQFEPRPYFLCDGLYSRISLLPRLVDIDVGPVPGHQVVAPAIRALCALRALSPVFRNLHARSFNVVWGRAMQSIALPHNPLHYV